MEKLELKHLAPYLPYGLQIKWDALGCQDVETLETLNFCEGAIFDKFKPILRPLSDLTKEIDHNGVKFVSNNYLGIKYLSLISLKQKIEYGNILAWQQQYLLQWNFDVSGLIEKGLAIDINTLKCLNT